MVNIKQQSAPPHSCSEEQNAVRKSCKRWSISLLSVLIIVFLLCAFDVRFKTVKYTVTSEKITAPVRIALVTDLHSCKYGKDQEVLVNANNKQNPDIILLGGDIFDDKISDRNTELFSSAIAGKYPCYYVTGNHEFWSYRIDEMLATLRACQVEILEGRSITLEVNDQKISLSGVDDPDAEYYTDKGGGVLFAA